jgi:hypothetical protein
MAVELSNLFDLTGKVAIVTGGAGSLGKAMALGLAKYGADIVVTGRTLATLEETVKEISEMGRNSIAITADVTSQTDVVNLVKKTVEEFGKIDILVNGAGIAKRFPAEEFPIEEFDKVLHFNVKGTFLCCQEVAKVMKEQGSGKIINVSSVRAFSGHPGGYAAFIFSKFLTITRIPTELSEALVSLPVPPIVVLIGIIIMYLLLGMIMDMVPAMFITLPVIFPAIVALGFDGMWFAVLLVFLAEVSMVTPPFGLSLFIIKSSVASSDLKEIYQGSYPFIMADFVIIILLVLFPQIITFLPSLM